MDRGPLEIHDLETGEVTGTADKDYNLVWFLEQCLRNTLRLEIFAKDADRSGDLELAEFFRRAQGVSRRGAEQSKVRLAARLARGSASRSAA